MTHFMRFLARFARYWWLTITLPARERRSQAIWEAAQGPEPPPFEGVPCAMGHIALRGLWHNFDDVARVSAAHNNRVDAYAEAQGERVTMTHILYPEPKLSARNEMKWAARKEARKYALYLDELRYKKQRVSWISVIGGVTGAFSAKTDNGSPPDYNRAYE